MLRRLGLLAIIALACLAVAACGDDDDNGGSPTPAGDTVTPVPSESVWKLGGQIDQALNLTPFSCTALDGYYQVLMIGQIADQQGISILIYTPKTGTIDYSAASSEATIAISVHTTDNTVNNSWRATSGGPGVSGTLVMDDKASGSVSNIVVPAADLNPGGAAQNVTVVSGSWTCPYTAPTNPPS